VWDPGLEEADEARTSFRSAASSPATASSAHVAGSGLGSNDSADVEYYEKQNNNSDDYVASLLRRQQENNSFYGDNNNVGGHGSRERGAKLGASNAAPPLPSAVVNHHASYGRMNRSGELDDILEESGDDEEEEEEEPSSGEVSPRPGCHHRRHRNGGQMISSSSPASSNSPQGSFRIIPRGVTNRSSQESTDSSSSSSKQMKSPIAANSTTHQVTTAPQPCYSQKSQDSGFSDSGDSAEVRGHVGGPSSVASNSSSSNDDGGNKRGVNLSETEEASLDDDLSLTNSSSEASCDDVDRNVSHIKIENSTSVTSQGGGTMTSPPAAAVRSEVVHETRTNVYDHKQYHVSKVYFYSVSDILNNENGGGACDVMSAAANDVIGNHPTPEMMSHVSILDCETGRIKRGYGLQEPVEPDDCGLPSTERLSLSHNHPPPPPPPQRAYSSLSNQAAAAAANDSFDSDSIPKLDPYACEMIPDNDSFRAVDNSVLSEADDSQQHSHHQFYFMEHKPLLPPKSNSMMLATTCTQTSPTSGSPVQQLFGHHHHRQSPADQQLMTTINQQQARIHAGTSSLGRLPKHHHKMSPVVSPNPSSHLSTHSSLHSRTLSPAPPMQSPLGLSSGAAICPSSPLLSLSSSAKSSTSSLQQQQQHVFPKTNGSLYESMSLGRPSSRQSSYGHLSTAAAQQKEVKKRTSLQHHSSMSEYHNLKSQQQPRKQPHLTSSSSSEVVRSFDSFDDPMKGARRSFKNFPSMQRFSQIFNEIKCNSSLNPVQFWLRELSLVHESECTIMLQSKPVAVAAAAVQQALGGVNGGDAAATAEATTTTLEGIMSRRRTLTCSPTPSITSSLDDVTSFPPPPMKSSEVEEHQYMWSGSSKDTIRAIQTRAHSISAVFAKLCKQLGGHRGSGSNSGGSNGGGNGGGGGIGKLVSLVQSLSHHINVFLVEYNKYNNLQLNLPGFRPPLQAANLAADCIPTAGDDSCNGDVTESRGSRSDVTKSAAVPEDVLHQQRLLLQTCDRLKLNVSRYMMLQTGSGSSPAASPIGGGGERMTTSAAAAAGESAVVDVITQVGATFTKLIELMLSKEIKSSVERLNERKSDLVLKLAIDSLITLALEGNHLCRLIAKHGGVRTLLEICLDSHLRTVRVNAFRALGTVCCVLEGIVELQAVGGVDVLADTLHCGEGGDNCATEEEKSEAAGLLAQVTSPWIENNTRIQGLAPHLTNLIQSLTALSRDTRSAETFLLASAALANLTFMEPSSVTLMKEFGTVSVLVSAVSSASVAGSSASSRTSSTDTLSSSIGGGSNNSNNSKGASIYIQDQVAAVLANMAANSECRGDVVKHGGIPLLLKFLHCNAAAATDEQAVVTSSDEQAQQAATERVLQKSAIAISRLCNDSHLAKEVVRLHGLGRLVELCKNEKARVCSDGVLVACLAAVRKISSVVGYSHFQQLDAAELVEPRLLDSFLIFSSRNESFV